MSAAAWRRGGCALLLEVGDERLTGVRERPVAGAGEDSYTLALGAARDALAHAGIGADDLDMLLVSSISRHVGGLRLQIEPPVSVSLKEALGARRAISTDISNACAGMLTGVFILNDLVRQGRIRRGMVVSGEYISELGRNAAQEVRDVLSDQLPSLTLGDAGAAAILERAPEGAPGIEVAGFTTLSGHSRLCVAFPATIGPGVTMHTKARENRPDVAEDARYAPVKGFLAAVPGRDQRFHVEDHRPDRQLPGRSEQISRPCHAYIAACHRSPRPLHSDVARVEGELIFELRPPLREDAGNGAVSWDDRPQLAEAMEDCSPLLHLSCAFPLEGCASVGCSSRSP